MGHSIWVVWHGELCDVEGNAPCLCIGELDDSAGFINMGHFIWGKSFAMFFESQSERCLRSFLCRFTQRLLTSYLWKHCCFLDCSISFLVVSLVFPFGQDITKSVGKKSTFLYLRPLGARRLVFVVAVISLPPPGGCSQQLVDVWLICVTKKAISLGLSRDVLESALSFIFFFSDLAPQLMVANKISPYH